MPPPREAGAAETADETSAAAQTPTATLAEGIVDY